MIILLGIKFEEIFSNVSLKHLACRLGFAITDKVSFEWNISILFLIAVNLARSENQILRL